MVLDLVPEEGTRAVDLLTSDNGDLLASEDLIIEKKCQRPSVDQSSSPSPSPFSCLARILKSFSLHSYTCHHNHTTLPYCARLDSFFSGNILRNTNLLGNDRSKSTEEVTFAVNDDRLGGESGHLLFR